jgi:MFS family permease
MSPSDRATRLAPDSTTRRRVALITAAVGGFLTPFMGSAVNIALPAIGAEFHLGAVSLGWVTSAFLLAAAVFLLPFGRLADIVGRKRVFVAGLTVFAVATLLCAVAPSGEALIALRLVQGLGGALIFGTGTAILTSVYSSDSLGRALGINMAAVYFGLSLGETSRASVSRGSPAIRKSSSATSALTDPS